MIDFNEDVLFSDTYNGNEVDVYAYLSEDRSVGIWLGCDVLVVDFDSSGIWIEVEQDDPEHERLNDLAVECFRDKLNDFWSGE